MLVWKLDRLGRDLRHLANTVHSLTERGIGLKVPTGEGAAIDTTTASGKLVFGIFGIFAALAEFERPLISERIIAGLTAAQARGRRGGRPYKMTSTKVRLAMAAMGRRKRKPVSCARNSVSHDKPSTAMSLHQANCARMGRNS